MGRKECEMMSGEWVGGVDRENRTWPETDVQQTEKNRRDNSAS
jgi:hypothetical protein